MIVAVVVMRVMQVPSDEVIHVVAVRDLLVTTTRAMHVLGLMPAAGMIGRAARRVGGANLDDIRREVAVAVTHTSVVERDDVISVLECCVAAIGSMRVLMLGVDVVVCFRHGDGTSV